MDHFKDIDLESRLGVIQGHWNWCDSTDCIWLV